MVKKIKKAKIACLDINLQKTKMHLGVNILIDDPNNLEEIRKRESDITTERIHKILNSGANVVFTTKGIDDMCLKLFIEAGAMAVRRCKKEDLKRISKATGATFLTTLANLDGDESFETSYLGTAESVAQKRVGDNECIFIEGTKNESAASIVLRGANECILDEMERSMHDALCIVKRTLESNTVVVGGGATETAVSIFLEDFATALASKEQAAVGEFANALLIIPKTLAVNATKESIDLVAKLRAYHNTAQNSTDKKDRQYKYHGLDLFNGVVRNNLEAGVIEPAISKIKSLKFATEAAISILRIDEMIKLAPERKEKRDPHHGLH